jgi:hypothetical protein
VDNTKGAIGAADTKTNGLDLKEVDFFRQLNKNAAIVVEDTKVEANIVHSFNSYRYSNNDTIYGI